MNLLSRLEDSATFLKTWDTIEYEDCYISTLVYQIENLSVADWMYEAISAVDEGWFLDEYRRAIYVSIRKIISSASPGAIVMPGMIAAGASVAYLASMNGILGSVQFDEVIDCAIRSTVSNSLNISFTPELLVDTLIPVWRLKLAKPKIARGAQAIIDALELDPTPELFEKTLPLSIQKIQETWDSALAEETNESESWTQTIDKVLAPLPEDNSISTGIKTLDDTIQGGIAGPGSPDACRLITIAARPGMGKTTFAVTLATYVAMSGYETAFFSLEMPATQIRYKAISCYDFLSMRNSGSIVNPIRSYNLRAHSFTKDQRERLHRMKYEGFIDRFDIFSGSQSAASLRSKIKMLSRMKQNLRAVFIDYLQLIDGCDGDVSTNQATAIGQVTKALKTLSVEIGVDIFLMCQVNRGVEQRSDKMPLLSDLRASGRIEEDSDIVTFLLRPAYYDESADPYQLAVGVAKNRNGETGTLACSIDLQSSVIFDNALPTASRI